MTFTLVFHPSVQDDIDVSYQFYEQQRAGLGDDFLDAVREVYHRIQSQPLAHQVVTKDVRRSLTRRFPFGVFYRVKADRVEVVAVYHLHQDPSGWQSRI